MSSLSSARITRVISSTMTSHGFTGTITISPGAVFTQGYSASGTLTFPPAAGSSAPPIPVYITLQSAAPSSNAYQTVGFAFQVPATSALPQGIGSVQVTLYPLSSIGTSTTYPPVSYPPIPVTIVSPVNDSASSSTGQATVASTSISSSGEARTSFPSPTGNLHPISSTGQPSPSETAAQNSGFNVGTAIGVSIACLVIGALLAGFAVFFCLRKRRGITRRALNEKDKRLPLLPNHGEPVYVAGNAGWEKHLPQADSDSSIRAAASRTLDQIAMHVENFYGSKSKVALNTGHEFQLDSINCSSITEPIANLLSRSPHPEDLIKHYLSSYIISMINFEDGDANGTFLPKVFRKQWQPVSQEPNTVAQAYSQWRVLTAYLRQQGDGEHTYIVERNKSIDTAADNICIAFEPWATTDKTARFQNLVSIMRRASELGVQLFSQPGRFEWRWERSGADVGSRNEIAILPGLYKMTGPNEAPLPAPVRLVEPVVVAV